MVSTNGVSLILLALSLFGINVAEQELLQAAAALGTLISFILMILNQVKRPNVSWFIFKK